MTDIITIPLNKLTPWKGNVRKTGATVGLDELAASIAAHGQLQSLVIREGKRGKYEILAGRRRYLAMLKLASNGDIAKDHPVQCTLARDGANATELSLVENTVRIPMHPADQFEAFRKLIDDGGSVTDVAARFGVSENLVAKRLKLGRLSPAVLEAYRNEDIDLEQAQAFAIRDDHAAQENVLNSMPQWGLNVHAIRRALTEDEISSSDKRVRFVGLDAYRAAGGLVRQDLFSDEDSGYIADIDLLDRLVAEKLAEAAETVKAEGWKWVEAVVDRDSDALSGFVRQYPDRIELCEADQAEQERLTHEYDELVDSDQQADSEQLDAVQEALDALSARMEVWPAERLATCGAVVFISHNGTLGVDRGLLPKSDAKKLAAEVAASGEDDVLPASPLSAALIADLSAQRTAALSVELADRPDIALAASVHALLVDRFSEASEVSALGISLRLPGLALSMKDADSSKPLAALNDRLEALRVSLPNGPDALWAYCLSRTQPELLSMLAVLVSGSLDAVSRSASQRVRSDSDRLAEALALDMTAWFTPTGHNYFSRISRAQILASIDEAKGSHSPSLEKLKKSELAVRAEALVAGTGWLPEPLRAAKPAAE